MVAEGAQALDAEAYRRWLASNTTLTGRSLGDAVSRTRRVLDMVDLSRAKTAEHVQIALLGNPAFKACSLTVQSQLKRAATLYVQSRRGGDA